ncbi:hypothetical protein TO66_20830 [Pseudomonas sp. MRSN 12121]|nr:hypothetical protein TO66_20830 [Pseudomonas sp. MRSN 12121]
MVAAAEPKARLRSSGTLAGILRALETLRVYRSLAGARQRLQDRGSPNIPVMSGACVAAAEPQARLRSSGTLAAGLRAPEPLRVYRSLAGAWQRLQGGDSPRYSGMPVLV